MKSRDQVNDARQELIFRRLTPGLSEQQLTLLQGMQVALCWVVGNPNGSTLENLLSGKPITPGVTITRPII